MSELFILLGLLVVGKIHGQEADASRLRVVHTRPVPSFDDRPVSHREHGRFQTPAPTQRLYTNAYRPADHLQATSGSVNLHLTPQTVRGTEPKRKLFISTKISPKMERPLDNNLTENNAGKPSSFGVNGDGTFERNTVAAVNDNVNLVKPPRSNVSSDNVPTVKPTNNTDGIPAVVDLDERSSFNGDPCPPGMVRINGECVKKD